MVLFVISLLLLTLMVCLTLSIGMKVREKMEVQAMADAAAYSNAAVTARVYNEIALMSRAQIGHMVSMAGVQSLISWTTAYRANANAIFLNYTIITAQYVARAASCCKTFTSCPLECPCAVVAAAQSAISAINVYTKGQKVFKQFDQLDQAAADQVRDLQGAASRLYAAQLIEWGRLGLKLNSQDLADDIVDAAKAGSPWPGELKAPNGGDSVTLREIMPFLGATNPLDISNSHHLYAGMGSRGFTFTTIRGGLANVVLNQQLKNNFVNKQDQLTVVDLGSAYFASTQNHGDLQPSGAFAWADDHGANTLRFNRAFAPCKKYSSIMPVLADLKSTDSGDSTDEHFWFPKTFIFFGDSDKQPADTRHTLGGCVRCPGMWPTFVDYNPVRLVMPSDNWGQPKNYAVIQRDYSVRGTRADPWNLLFRFRFSPNRTSQFDNRGIQLADGTNISKQTGLSAGIAYYHRKGHWKEPPNLLNPYWRATIVPLTIDSQGRGGDVADTLNDVGAGWAATAWNGLRGQGYEGGP
ncbi:pilus assembly protein TadG-related protein [Archangium sp.]|uniref:pilus assembly protein TadG-related protein n=1 Tax=Archangium sp. TaxID=1872627 RepID=UPI003899CCE7